LYVNYVASAAEMTDLPLPLRERLAAETRLEPLQPLRLQQADGGMTQKALFELDGGAVVESVLMVYPDRATVCVSTQAGCAMDCSFCATGRLGLLRNLSPGEIVGQVLWAARVLRELAPDHGPRTTDHGPRTTPATMGRGRANGVADAIWWSPEGIEEQQEQRAGNFVPRVGRLTNVVFMGMGEPFANYDRWWRAVERLHDPRGFNMGARGLTVSTVGLVPGIRRLAEAPLPINLAISLHAANDELRSAMMPVNRRYPLAELMAATREYVFKTKRRVSFEYVLLQGQNDAPEQAAELVARAAGLAAAPRACQSDPVEPGAGDATWALGAAAGAGVSAGVAGVWRGLHCTRRARRSDRSRLRPVGRDADHDRGVGATFLPCGTFYESGRGVLPFLAGTLPATVYERHGEGIALPASLIASQSRRESAYATFVAPPDCHRSPDRRADFACDRYSRYSAADPARLALYHPGGGVAGPARPRGAPHTPDRALRAAHAAARRAPADPQARHAPVA
jgi:23S rRNA (adenine2503-C2)-methyltransferase